MLDQEKQIEHWRAGAREDWDAAAGLVEQGRWRHGLFFAHLALEKLLKAHVCRKTGKVAPRIHSLLRLADQAGLAMDTEQRAFIGKFDRLQIQGRYPDIVPVDVDVVAARQEFEQAREVFAWLNRQF